MELAGIAAGGHLRSTFSDFDIKNAAELEAHINMNAAAAKINFDKYYSERYNDLSRVWRENRRRLDVKDVLEVPAFVLDVGASKFDYSCIGQLYHEKQLEKEKGKEARKSGAESFLTVNVKANMDDPFKLVITGCDYTNVEKVVSSLKDNTEVTHLSFANNGLEADDCDALAVFISTNRTVVSLDLSNNKLGGEGVEKLSAALAKNSSITDLDLGANQLSKSAAKSLAAALLAPSCRLTRLQLSGNALGIYGAEELAVGLKGNVTVTAVGLQNNNIGNDGANKLLDILPGKAMSIDEVTTDSLLPLSERKYNTSLVQISLEANRIDDPLALAISNGTWLNEQVQMRHYLVRLEEEARRMVEDVEPELQALELLFAKATSELKTAIAEKEAAQKTAAAAPAKGGKAPPAKPGAKVAPPKAAPAGRSASKSPAKPTATAAPPATSGKVKAAAGAGGGKNPSPKKTGK